MKPAAIAVLGIGFAHAHIGLADVALIAVVLGYLTLQVKDFRPIRQLRQENAELRDALEALTTRCDELERHNATLEKTRDFQASFDLSIRAIDESRAAAASEHAAILSALASHGDEELKAWTQLQREMAANTAVLSTLAAGINAGALAASAPHRIRPATS